MQCDPKLYSSMQTITGSATTNNLIWQRYKLISNPAQTLDWQSLSSGTTNLEVNISIDSPFKAESSEQFVLLVKCLKFISLLFATSPIEGLEEASEALESMVEYYKNNTSDWQQSSLPQSLEIITGNVLPSEVRPPLILDFE